MRHGRNGRQSWSTWTMTSMWTSRARRRRSAKEQRNGCTSTRAGFSSWRLANESNSATKRSPLRRKEGFDLTGVHLLNLQLQIVGILDAGEVEAAGGRVEAHSIQAACGPGVAHG